MSLSTSISADGRINTLTSSASGELSSPSTSSLYVSRRLAVSFLGVIVVNRGIFQSAGKGIFSMQK